MRLPDVDEREHHENERLKNNNKNVEYGPDGSRHDMQAEAPPSGR
jgi:hypothetical protein